MRTNIKWIYSDPWPPFYDQMILMFQKEVAERIVATSNNKKYGVDVMYDCYLGDITEREAAEFMKQTEEIADEFAARKIRQLQKMGLIEPFTPPQMYKNIPIQQITMMVNNYRNDMKRKNIDSQEKVSEYFYNMVKSEL